MALWPSCICDDQGADRQAIITRTGLVELNFQFKIEDHLNFAHLQIQPLSFLAKHHC